MSASGTSSNVSADCTNASVPSREGVPPPRATQELPDYIAPPPKNAAARQAWEWFHLRMETFHDHFRREFQKMYTLADKVGNEVELGDYFAICEAFTSLLTRHHDYEEFYVFPVLAQRMPAFADSHVEEHKVIHDGLGRLGSYLKTAKSKTKSFSAEEIRGILSSFGPVMFFHLDAEVNNLKPDMLRRYYTLDEVRRLF